MNDLWIELTQRAGVALTPAQGDLLGRYLDLLLSANATFNLTRIVDRAGAETQHVGDALSLLPLLPPGPIRLADVGSGGGVPGIPLAIVRPDARVLLVEATRKKADFLRQTVAALGLDNIEIDDRRAEEVGADPKRREAFDVVVARALGKMIWLVEWCLPLARVGGKVVAMKGPRVHEELPEARRALRQLGGAEPVVHPAPLPGADGHLLIEIRKTARTDARYPRAASRAKGRPIG